MEAQILYLYPGAYKNFDELENSLTQEEMTLMYQKAYELKYEDHRFQAAIQGVDLDEGSNNKEKAEEVIERAKAKAAGMNEQELVLDGTFKFIEE